MDFVVMLDSVWETRKVRKEWVDAILIPVPQKGNLRSCDNWYGVALLEVIGKVVVRVIQGTVGCKSYQKHSYRNLNVASEREEVALT